jgi:hypothetical protein
LKLVFITKQQGAPCTHFLGASNSESNLTIVGLKKKKHYQQIGFSLFSFSFILSHLIGESGKQKLQKFLETFVLNELEKKRKLLYISFLRILFLFNLLEKKRKLLYISFL